MAIEEENQDKLRGVFRNIDFNSETLGQVEDRNRRLSTLLGDFARLNLGASHLAEGDQIGDAYEYLMAAFASGAGKKAGEFFTPSQVSTLLAKLLAPRPGERLCDPTCGSGSLLIKLARQVGNENFTLYGQDVNGTTWAMARMNMFLHDLDDAQIEWGDTLNDPRLLEKGQLMQFDVVAANPPFSLDKWGAEKAPDDPYDRFYRGVPPKSKGDYVFISHMLAMTYPKRGRVGVIVPHGVLFRGGSEGRIRQQLIEEHLLEAVIGLPKNLFFGTSIPAAILLFNKARGPRTDTLFIEASQGYAKGKKQHKLRPEDIERMVATYQRFQAGPPVAAEGRVVEERYAYQASLVELQANAYNLNISRYVDTVQEEAPIDLQAVNKELQALRGRLIVVEQEMSAWMKFFTPS